VTLALKAVVCTSCSELYEGKSLCPACGGPLVSTRAAVEAWEHARQERRIATWRSDGVIDDVVAEKILASIRAHRSEPPKLAPGPVEDHAIEKGARAVVDGGRSFFAEVGTRYARVVAAIEEDAPPPSADAEEEPGERSPGVEAGRAVFGGSSVVGAGIEALGELDDREEGPAKPLGALQVFWFIGTVLVLAGSLMGVREAWRSFEGALRPLSIAAALFAYHAAFVGLSRLLAKRSAVTGRVLGVIATGLLPVAFVAVAITAGMSPKTGWLTAAVLLGGSAVTLGILGKRVFPGVGNAIAMALLPCLVLEVPLAPGGPASWPRLALPLVALVPLGVVAVRSRKLVTPGLVAAGAAALYGAVCVAIVSLYGGPNDPTLAIGTFGPATLAMLLWLALFATLVWRSFGGDGLEAVLPRFAAPVAILGLALLTGTALTATLASIVAPRTTLLDAGLLAWAPAFVVALAAGAMLREPRGRALSIHLAIPLAHLAAFLAARTALAGGASTWTAATAIVPCALFVVSPWAVGRGRRFAVPIWACLSGAILFAEALGLDVDSTQRVSPLVGLALAVAAHAGARNKRPLLHLYGAAAAFAALCAWGVPQFLRDRPDLLSLWVPWFATALAAAYGVAGFLWARFDEGARDTNTLDDASLALATVGLWFAILAAPAARGFSAIEMTMEHSPLVVLAFVLALRSVRDRSIVVSTQAALAVAAAVYFGVEAQTAGESAIVLAACALALLLPASLRAPQEEKAPKFGRAIVGIVPLPLRATGATLLDGAGIASVLLALLAYGRGFTWIVARAGTVDPFAPGSFALENDRILVVVGAVLIVAVAIVGFSTRALARIDARGNVGALIAGGVAIALAAVANRIGHPLPPAVVGWKLSLIAILVWLVSRGFVKWGPAVARKLARPAHGRLYHYVPHAGVFALGALLLVDALLVGSPTVTRALVVVPPLLVLGGATAMLLLYRSFGARLFLHAGLAALLAFAAIAGAQHALLGPELVPLDPPGGRWVLAGAVRAATQGDWLDPTIYLPSAWTETLVRERALAGSGVFALVCAGLLLASTRVAATTRLVAGTLLGRPEAEHDEIIDSFAIWTTTATAFLTNFLAFQPAFVACALLLAVGVVAALATRPVYRFAALGLSAPLFVHALAHLSPAVPPWTGPAMALLGLLAVLVGSRQADRRATAATQVAMILYATLGVIYAAATDAPTDARNAVLQVLSYATVATDGSWAHSPSLAATLGITAVATAIAAWSWKDDVGRILAAVPPLALAAAGAALAAALAYTGAADVFPRVLTRDGALLALALAAAATVAHGAVHALRARGHAALASGTAFGRDVVLFSSAAAMSAFVLLREPGGDRVGMFGIGAFGLCIAVSLDAMLRERTARHVYLVETLVLALYSFATRELRPRPEMDAILGLAYGFTLLGVAVVARRQQVSTIAVATRRFLVALPIIVAALTTNGASGTSAAIALGASVLYGAVALTEKSRIFSSLAAIAINAALVVFAVAEGLDGIEIYIGPLGLLVAMLSQIFGQKMSKPARSTLRILAGALLYLPSGLKLTLRLGAADDATYSVVFGAICLLGVVVGLALRVRAYLALATAFLVLDVVANLVNVGLRDHRIGFVLLSTTGLLILGVMILVTLRREAARGVLDRVKGRLRAWD
jgi:hypothetical protein